VTLVTKLERKISRFFHVLLKTRRRATFSPYILNYKPAPGKTKIVHVNGNFIVGGTTQLIIDIIERSSDEYSHQLIVPSYAEPLPYQPVSIKSFSISEMMDLYKYLEKEEPAVVHVHYWVREQHRYHGFALWYAAVFKICEELQLKVIQNINVPTRPFESAAVVHNVFVSNYVYKTFNSAPAIPTSVIYPGSNFSHFSNKDVRQLPGNNVGMAYRLDEDKLNKEVIEIFLTIVKKAPAIKCYIIGDGLFYAYYVQRVKEEGLEANFIFTGMVSYAKLPEYYKYISVFVAPVHDESFGQVTPFAMSMGLAVAGYNTGAISEILGSTDTLVEPGDICKLSDIIIDLVTDSDKRIALGERNQQRAHSYFSVEAMISAYKDLYQLHAHQKK
jgi:glycosyltransferase involved in cell wall biosynthesis